MRGIRHWAVVGALVASVASVAAEPEPETPRVPRDPGELFRRARELIAQGRFAEACTLFDNSYALEPAVGTALNVADCREREGKLADAWRLFDHAARVDDKPGRAKFARDRADALVAKTGELVLHLYAPQTPGLEVTIGGRRVQIADEIHERVDPGTVHVVVSAPDRQPFQSDAQITAGSTARVDVPPLSSNVVKPPVTGPPPPVVIAPVVATTHRRGSRVIASGVLAGAGVVALAVAGGLAISARGKYRDAFDGGHCVAGPIGPVCDDTGVSQVNDAASRADVTTGVAIAAAALIGAGVIVFVTAPRDPDESLRAAVGSVAGGWGLVVGGRF